MLVLSTPLVEMSKVQKLPDIFEKQQLHMAAIAALYVLGHESKLRDEGWIPAEQTDAAVRELFLQWKNQPAKEELPPEPDYVDGEQVSLRSVVLGTRISVSAANNVDSIQLAETILGALEAFLATSADYEGLFAYREQFAIELVPSVEVSGLLEIADPYDAGEEVIRIRHAPNLFESLEKRLELRDRAMKIIGTVIPRIAVAADIGKHLEKIARDEGALTRSLAFSEISVWVENILGNAPKLRLSDWFSGQAVQDYPLQREAQWDAECQENQAPSRESIWSKIGNGEPPEMLIKRDFRHNRRVVSLIDIPLWNQAQWGATLFAYSPNTAAPPFLGIAFRNPKAGQEIFQNLRRKLGEVDTEERLRISIITDIDRRHLFAYSVIVTRNLDMDEGRNDTANEFLIVSRINRMNPQDGNNLRGFLESFRRANAYHLAPAHLKADAAPECFFDLGIVKRELIIPPAWQISDNDPDIMALQSDDEPVIPQGMKDAPVERALSRIKRMRMK